MPGGRVELGEDDATATAREVLEETGLEVVVGGLVGTVERDAPDGSVYAISDYRCTPVEHADLAAVLAGDDAVGVGWFTPDEIRRLVCAPGLVAELEGWGVLPPAGDGPLEPAQPFSGGSTRVGRPGCSPPSASR